MGNKSSSSASGGGKRSTSTITANSVTRSQLTRASDRWLLWNQRTLCVGKSISSGTFSVGGHNWFIRYYPDGYNTKSAGWISIDLHLDVPPSTDDTVVKARFKFSLPDQDGEPVPAFERYTRDLITFSATGTRSWGFDQFIKKNSDFEASNYLKGDCFSIRCEVTVMKGIRTKANRKKKFVTVPPSNLHRELGGLLAAGEGADVTFGVGGELFTAHRNVLAARSSVFKAAFFGPIKEKMSSSVQIRDMAQHLLVTADRYDLKRLKLVCEDKLCNHIEKSTVATTLVLAEQHGCKGLKACFAFLMSRGNLKSVMPTEGYHHLRSSCPSLLDELISKLAP